MHCFTYSAIKNSVLTSLFESGIHLMHVLALSPAKHSPRACVEAEQKGASRDWVLLQMIRLEELWCDRALYKEIPALRPGDSPSISEEFCYGFTHFILRVTSSRIPREMFLFTFFYRIFFRVLEQSDKMVFFLRTSAWLRYLLTVTVWVCQNVLNSNDY